MPKKSKLSTPDWIREGYNSKADWEKKKGIKNKKKAEGKKFKIRKCPKCGSTDVGLVLSNSDSEEAGNTGKQWQCHKCKWTGGDIEEEDLTEEEFMKYLDEKGEKVA